MADYLAGFYPEWVDKEENPRQIIGASSLPSRYCMLTASWMPLSVRPW